MKSIDSEIIGIVGTGLIGTSFALALKDSESDRCILGYDTNKTHVQQAMKRGAFDACKENLLELAEHCDILVVATPIGAVRSIFVQLQNVADRIIITDVGSVKRSVIDDARSVWGKVPATMIPAHPIAGGEESGPNAAAKELFKAHYVFLTPHSQSDMIALSKIQSLWQQAGAKIETLSPEQHDELFAATSHLPHVVAYALINSLKQTGINPGFAAGGLKDFTRIAASDPTMWRDIFIANSDCILESVKIFEKSIETIRKMIERKQGARLFELLEKTVIEKKRLNRL